MSTWSQDVLKLFSDEFGQSPWVCVMATCDHANNPRAQAMVCREIDRDGRLIFITDRRLHENDDLRSQARCEIVFWLRTSGAHVRIRGTTAVIDAETDLFTRESMWERLASATRAVFTGGADDGTAAMPPTFELLIVSPDKVELRRQSDTKRRVWRTGETGWTDAAAL